MICCTISCLTHTLPFVCSYSYLFALLFVFFSPPPPPLLQPTLLFYFKSIVFFFSSNYKKVWHTRCIRYIGRCVSVSRCVQFLFCLTQLSPNNTHITFQLIALFFILGWTCKIPTIFQTLVICAYFFSFSTSMHSFSLFTFILLIYNVYMYIWRANARHY